MNPFLFNTLFMNSLNHHHIWDTDEPLSFEEWREENYINGEDLYDKYHRIMDTTRFVEKGYRSKDVWFKKYDDVKDDNVSEEDLKSEYEQYKIWL